jgi:hypothetical protein
MNIKQIVAGHNMTTSIENSIQMPSTKRNKVFWGIVAIALACIAFIVAKNTGTMPGLAEGDATQGTASVKAAQSTPASAMPTEKRANVNSLAATADVNNLTYRPGKSQPFRQFTGTIDRKSISSEWWLYARSEEEAKWLDFYGYPTPAQHAKLKVATDGELRALADAGDANAKAHLSTRAMAAIFEKQDVKKLDRARVDLEILVADGSAYTAMTLMQGYGGLISAYQATPQESRTDAQREILEKLGANYYMAYLKGLLYSDDTIRDMKINIAGLDYGYWSSPSISKDFNAESFLMGLRGTANRRVEEGLPPLVITPRPRGPVGDRPIYLERQ